MSAPLDSLSESDAEKPLSADELLESLCSEVGSWEQKEELRAKIQILTRKLAVGRKTFPFISAVSLNSLLEALFAQIELSASKEMASIRNDLALILLLIAKGDKKLRKEFGIYANKIGLSIAENVLGSVESAFPLHSRPLDVQLLTIFVHLISLILKGQNQPQRVIEECALVETAIALLIGPCPLLDSVGGDEGILHAAWELLHTLSIIHPNSFAREEGLGAMLSYLSVYSDALGPGSVNMSNVAIFLDVMRKLFVSERMRKYAEEDNAITILVGVLDELSRSDWDHADDSLLCNLLLCLAALGNENRAQQSAFFAATGVKILLRLLNRLVYAPPEKRHMDSRLSTCLGECIWRCIGSSASSLETWLGFEGMFRLLDLLEMGLGRDSELKLMGVLLELCEYPRCMDQVLYWKRRNPPVRSVPTELSGKEFDQHDMSLGAFLCELWRKEESLLGVARSKEGLIANLERPLTSALGQESDGHSPVTLDLICSLRPKIHLLAKKITDATNTEATLFGGLSLPNQVTMELIINFIDLKCAELWLEMGDTLQGIPLVESDAAALIRYIAIAKNKVLTVLDTQHFLLCRDQEKKLIEERELYLRIRESELQDHLLGVREAEEMARTSNYMLLLDKRLWQKAQLAKARKDFANFKPDAAIHLTTSNYLNVTPWPGRTKVMDSEDRGFVEDKLVPEVRGEGDWEEPAPDTSVMPSRVTSYSVMRPSQVKSLADSPGVTDNAVGFYEVHPQVLTKALMAAIKEETKWNWKEDDEGWNLRTKWKSSWY